MNTPDLVERILAQCLPPEPCFRGTSCCSLGASASEALHSTEAKLMQSALEGSQTKKGARKPKKPKRKA